MPTARRFAALILAGTAGLCVPSPASGQLAVAAASDLQSVMPLLAERYRQATGDTLRVSFGSSGQFVSQIQNGAPFDVFLSADADYASRLVTSGHAVAGSLTRYATGRLVLWARQDRGLDVTRGLELLTDPRVRRIAVANPQHAPYGKAAVTALQRVGLYERIRSRLVLGENIAQAAQFAESGNADVGIIALSLALTPALRASGSYHEVPQDLHPPISQAAVVLTASTRRDRAVRFLEFLAEPATIDLLRSFGFSAP